MKKTKLGVIVGFVSIILLSCQTKELSVSATKIKEQAITIENLADLNTDIYREISKYDVILMGEMHGTMEPSEFVYGLSKLIADKEGNVTLALELPSSLLTGMTDNMTKERLKVFDFFSGENRTGQNGEACLDLIYKANQDSRINLEFIDNYIASTRDSSMYAAICEIKKAAPYTKIVTLTGNIHNRLIPYNDEQRIGGYLLGDTVNFDPTRIMSINHYFNHGTMLNNIGNGLELQTFDPSDNIYNQTISSKMYLCSRISEEIPAHTHFLYTEEVTHSNPIQTE